MEFIQQEVLWGADLWRFAVALVLIFAGFLSRRILVAIFGGILKKQAGSTEVHWDDDLVELCAGPLALVAQIGIWYAAARVLELPTEPADVQQIVFQGLLIALAVAVTWLFFRLLDVAAGALARVSDNTDSKLDDQLVPLLRKTLKVFVSIIIVVMVIQNLGYSVTSIIASLGIGGLALALAAKDAVANFFGSLIVFTDQPFHVGDWIEVNDVSGIVEEVGFRTTIVRTFEKSVASVPNQTFTSNTIVNHSRRPVRRIKMVIGLTYDATPDQINSFCDEVKKLISGNPSFDEGHYVYFESFGDSSLNVLVQCFIKTTDFVEYMSAKEKMMLDIMRIVERLGLEIAFPTQTVHLKQE
ncbi:MAG: mechanosensitive ion channel family protein [Rhodothermales bacterium]|nr:mechanosensitive ion channel family protein [Rhodothermales bacterium]